MDGLPVVVLGGVAQAAGRGRQQLAHQCVRQRVEHLPALVVVVGRVEPRPCRLEFALLEVLCTLVHRGDDAVGALALVLREEVIEFLVDDGLDGLGGLVALLAGAVGDGLQCVEVADGHPVERLALGVHVTGLCDIDHVRLAGGPQVARFEHRFRAVRRRDDHVRALDGVGHRLEAEHLGVGVDVAGELPGALDGAVRDEEHLDVVGQCRRRERAHLAGTDDHPGGVVEAVLLPDEADRGAAERDGSLVDGGVVAGPLADVQHLQECIVEHRSDAAGLARLGVGGPDLPEYLVLAEHERFEAGRHAHEMSEALLVAEFPDRILGHVGDEFR